MPHTEDTVRGQNGGRLSIGDSLYCTFLSYEDQKLPTWPKQGCGNITGWTRWPPAGHRLNNYSTGTILCRPAQNSADRPKMPDRGQFCHFTTGLLKIGFLTLFLYFSTAENCSSLSLELFLSSFPCFLRVPSPFHRRIRDFLRVSDIFHRLKFRFGASFANLSLERVTK